ncbi:VOC family protein [Roseomonas stagni]|uniref:VOC family protein n=1 Tax=Falsiroseomonas algicola TaxID=2716930 RepID=A0A6M1LJF7_9PROT|nr:VOC family protein [Falsiroseomonas algicola]NGM20119.1 VOC family protein [Falsiroseomonas algicola]
MSVQPYLFFEGRCEEALAFYRAALGAEVTAMMRFRDNPDGMYGPPGSEEKVMHAEMRIGDAVVMASDGGCTQATQFSGFGLAVGLPDAATLDRHFAALSEGGEVRMPPAQTFFSPRFGIVADRFGVQWMLMVAA